MKALLAVLLSVAAAAAPALAASLDPALCPFELGYNPCVQQRRERAVVPERCAALWNLNGCHLPGLFRKSSCSMGKSSFAFSSFSFELGNKGVERGQERAVMTEGEVHYGE